MAVATSTPVSEKTGGKSWITRREFLVSPAELLTPWISGLVGLSWRGVWEGTVSELDLVRAGRGFWLVGSTNLVAAAESALSELAFSGLVLRNPLVVRDYLLNHPDMISLALKISKAARIEFGGDRQLSIEIYGDPEIEDHHMVLYVRQPEYGEQLLEEIDEFSKKYELAMRDTSGWLLVTTDFAPP